MTQVTIVNTGQTLFCPPETDLYKILSQAGLMERPCGGIGCCGKCKVKILTQEAPPPSKGDEKFFSASELAQGFRLACLCYPTQDLTLELPAETKDSAITSQGHMRDCPHDPSVQKRLTAQGDTEVLLDGTLIAVEPGDTRDSCYGIAVDIGTTTVVATLVDLLTGKELGVRSCLNSQNTYGQDVISRIHYAGANPDGTKQLQTAILKDLRGLCAGLLQQTQLAPEQVYQITIGANTTMVHLLSLIHI